MAEERATPPWLNVLWLILLLGLALSPPLAELHKTIILVIFGVFQVLEKPFVKGAGPRLGPMFAVLIKLTLAAILMNHTRDLAINSSYWPIFLLPVTTAAMYFGPLATMAWTTAAAGAYCAYLIPALRDFRLDMAGASELGLRILFFYLVAMLVNPFATENRVQVKRYQTLSRSLAEANESLRQAQEEARRAERLAALGQLSAGLAHEIRNPLGVIKGSAEILKGKLADKDPLSQELSEYIYTEVNRLSALVSRFLDFARPSPLHQQAEDLPALIERSWKAVSDTGCATKVKLVREYAPGLPPAYVDPEMTEQVFTNLLVNACEAMGDKGGELWVRISPASAAERSVGGEANRMLQVEVEDSGPGVTPELGEQIFNPFVSSKKTGVGLGLAVVSKIVDAHGGKVALVQRGKGACFRVTLPEQNPFTTKDTKEHEGSQNVSADER